MVERTDRPAIAAGWKCSAQGYSARDSERSGRDFAREHRIRPEPSCRSGPTLHAVCARHGERPGIKVYRNVCERVHTRLWRSWTRGHPPVSWRSPRTRLYRSQNLDRVRKVNIGRRYFFFAPGDGEAFGLLTASTTKFFTRSASCLKPFVKSWVTYSTSTTKENGKKTNRKNQKSPQMRAIAQPYVSQRAWPS